MMPTANRMWLMVEAIDTRADGGAMAGAPPTFIRYADSGELPKDNEIAGLMNYCRCGKSPNPGLTVV